MAKRKRCAKPLSVSGLSKCSPATIAKKLHVPLVTKLGKHRTKKTLLNIARKKSKAKLKRSLKRKRHSK